MKGAPRSAQFDDIYFSAENGLEETAHVFLRGNNLPAAWEGKPSFTIAETGFGTGLNFFSVWKLFEEHASADQTLDFISVEKYPLSPQEIKQALEPWQEFLGNRVDLFLAQYPLRIAGFHRVKLTPQITLTLIFDDINLAFPQLEAKVDCWFLDGFTPAKNPDMWSDIVFREMARLSAAGASYATFTAAGDVRRALASAGFSVQKQKGFGHKRDMIAGRYDGQEKPSKQPLKKGARIAIIGGGLAGTSCAYVLKQYGYDPVIYEAADTLASGASGNTLGLYNPRFSKLRDNLSDFFAPAYAQFIRTVKQMGDAVNYVPCGALHLMNDPDKETRYRAMAKNWLWHENHIAVLSSAQASEIAGIKIDYDALYLPDSGSVSPQKLCEFYARDIEVHFNSEIDDLSKFTEDAIILTCGPAIKDFDFLSWLPLDAVRGQVTKITSTENTKNLKCNLHYGGYISKAYEGSHMIGATFEKWVRHTEVTEENHQDNVMNLKKNVAIFQNEDFEITAGRAGMRAATNDRFPVVGAVPEHDNMFISAAFGSHGLVGSVMAAHYLADLLRSGPFCLPIETSNALIPKRFLDRAKKKGSHRAQPC
ncbi:MAG TPA: bifunctional tRNA (5-methylaminomethyl-2-thiouridine)(34)-methyltransferase MnmD/FAD-dependent 5-carboxymethylaminomethyl-2-thiouridine(34) oxidoreductase MnmC [Alphaproteobacteria bacterium]|nr:bifunctional tRNA (5-methylaminomethyl-2-thiouridine)(34)-methyltransferase MnmD/FAD-dependent 5-carboxymethylaminomethyl-2-thiouridine(34) oxidoreductase MnmC [Alphaproteobacteria bacterium]